MLMFKIFLLMVGFVLLIKGADVFVDGASAVATRMKVPKMLIGLTIVAFGTSAPEFAVSVKSLMSGNGDMLLGNVIGSNILNIWLILGLTAMIREIKVRSDTVKTELPILVLMTLAFAALILDRAFSREIMVNGFTRQDGVILVLMFGIFIYHLVGMVRREKNRIKKEKTGKVMSWWLALAMTVGGILGIIFGSDMVVNSASEMATMMGVSQKMVALTVIALGTSLPELATSIMAARKGESDIAIGNVVGSNIFNIAMVAGLPVIMFGGIPEITFSYIDVAAMVLAAVLLYLVARKKQQIGRTAGLMFLGLFVIYYGYVIMTGLQA